MTYVRRAIVNRYLSLSSSNSYRGATLWRIAITLLGSSVAAAFCAGTALPRAAESNRPLVLVGKSYPQYQQVADAFRDEWQKVTGIEPIIMPFPAVDSKKKHLLATRPKIVVGLGEIPTLWALGQEQPFRLAFSMVVAPERLEGFARMLSRSPRKMTGVSIEIAPDRQIQLLHMILPNVKRVGVITHTAGLRDSVSQLTALCAGQQIEVTHVEVESLAEFPLKIKQLLTRVDLLWSLPDPAILQAELAQHMIAQCAEHRVALLGMSSTFVKSGATISFDPDYAEVGELLARVCMAHEEEVGSLTIASTETIVVNINERSFRTLELDVITELNVPRARVMRF